MNPQGARDNFYKLKVLEKVARSWFHATYTLMIIGAIGNYWVGMIPNVVYHATMALFDPITGYLGDIGGHLRIYLLGAVIYTAGDIVYFLSGDLATFALAEFILAIASALMSEALESWLTNNVGTKVAHEIKVDVTVFRLAIIVPSILGAIIGAIFGKQYAFLLSAITMAVISYTAYIMIVSQKNADNIITPLTAETNGKSRLHKVWIYFSFGISDLANGLKNGFAEPELRMIFMVHFLTNNAFQSINMLWALILATMSGSEAWLGAVWIGITFASAYGAEKVRKHNDPSRKDIGFALATIALPLFVASITSSFWVVLAGFLIHQAGRAALGQLIDTYADHRIPNQYRATLRSTLSAARFFGGTSGLLTIYLLGEFGLVRNPQINWQITALIFAILSLFFLLKSRK